MPKRLLFAKCFFHHLQSAPSELLSYHNSHHLSESLFHRQRVCPIDIESELLVLAFWKTFLLIRQPLPLLYFYSKRIFFHCYSCVAVFGLKISLHFNERHNLTSKPSPQDCCCLCAFCNYIISYLTVDILCFTFRNRKPFVNMKKWSNRTGLFHSFLLYVLLSYA